MTSAAPPRVLAVASAGGHLAELRRLRRAFAGCPTTWVITDAAYADEIRAAAAADGAAAPDVRTTPEAGLFDKIALLRQALSVAAIVLRVRPHVVITTGAAAGYFAIRFGRLIGARTIWIDSIANADALSAAGRRAGPHADLFLTQWPHLVDALGAGRGPRYLGAAL